MLRKLKTALSLPRISFEVFLYCLPQIPVSGLLLKYLGYKRTSQIYLNRPPINDTAPPGQDEYELIRNVRQGFSIATKYSLYAGSCLSRSILMKALLQKHGVSTNLRIGVNQPSIGGFSAHSWLESSTGEVICGEFETGGYVPLDVTNKDPVWMPSNGTKIQ